MPAFVDPDASIGAFTFEGQGRGGRVLRITSRKSLQVRAAVAAAERIRYGCVTVGSHTPLSADLRSVIKVLRVQRTLQAKPLRIRSIFSCNDAAADDLEGRWLPAIRREKLASVVEFRIDGPASHDDLTAVREAAITAAAAGFAI